MEIKKLVEKYKMIFDHHTHTVYSHGKGTILDNVKAAHEKGLKSIAITEHGPGNFSYGVNLKKLPDMRKDISEAVKKYPDVEVLLGVEANTIRNMPYLDVCPDDCAKLDILLAGYHYAVLNSGMIFNRIGLKTKSLIVKNTDMILNALYYNEEAGNHIDILTHPGDKGPFDIKKIAEACEKTGTLMEINGKHPHLSTESIRTASKFDVKFVISSDAHSPEYVGVFEPQLGRALEAGLEPERIVNISER